MFKDGYLFFFPNFVEVVHVELPDERRELFVFEVFGENLVLKKILILHDKAASVVSPFYDMAILFVLQNFIGLHDEV